MIEILQKENCCGCHACVQRCPQQCISMHEDIEGFLYPQVDQSKCINCNLCNKVCPVLNQGDPRQPLQVKAAKNPDKQIRIASSSGGIFTLLAEQILQIHGVVFGARFNDNWEIVHDCLYFHWRSYLIILIFPFLVHEIARCVPFGVKICMYIYIKDNNSLLKFLCLY